MKAKELSHLWQLLLPLQRRSAVALLGLMMVGAGLDTVGVGLALPVIAVLAGAETSGLLPAGFQDWLAGHDRSTLIVAGVLLLLFAFLLCLPSSL